MKNFDKERKVDNKALNRIILLSGIIAIILSVPAVSIFIVVYNISDNVWLSVISGFIIHFILLSKSEKISKLLIKIY